MIETNFGRNCGWYVELDGQRVARLTDPRWEDMFWYSYLVQPVTQDPAVLALLHSPDFWVSGDLVYRNCEFDAAAPYAFAAGCVKETGRVVMRRLYLTTLWVELLAWLGW